MNTANSQDNAFRHQQEQAGRLEQYERDLERHGMAILHGIDGQEPKPLSAQEQAEQAHRERTDALFRRAKAVSRPDLLAAYIMGSFMFRTGPLAHRIGNGLPVECLDVIEGCLENCEELHGRGDPLTAEHWGLKK